MRNFDVVNTLLNTATAAIFVALGIMLFAGGWWTAGALAGICFIIAEAS